MKKFWSKKEQRILDRIEAKMIATGVPERWARLHAEEGLERRIARKREWASEDEATSEPVEDIYDFYLSGGLAEDDTPEVTNAR